MDASTNPVAAAIDGATGDWSMSGDAMRWCPDLAETEPAVGVPRSVHLAGDPSGGPELDMTAVRRFVSDALSALGAVATDVVSEFRQLARGPAEDDEPR